MFQKPLITYSGPLKNNCQSAYSPINSKASSKYCFRFWWPESDAGICLYVIPHSSWYPGSCEVTFSTQVVPNPRKQDRSAASYTKISKLNLRSQIYTKKLTLLLPRYKKGKTFDAGYESTSARLGQDAEGEIPLDAKLWVRVCSHNSLCFR